MARNLGAIAIVASAVVSNADPAAAQNQVFNGGFARDLAGWTQGTYMVWGPVDAAGSAFSGSLLVVNTQQSNAQGLDQCLSGPSIVPGATYTYSQLQHRAVQAGPRQRDAAGHQRFPVCGREPALP
jgi:hypothetical protein